MSNDMLSRNLETRAPVLPSAKSLGSHFLASYGLCFFFSAVETGVILVLFSRFLARRAFAESTTIKLLVYFVTFFSLFQTGMTFASWWKIFVLDFANWGAAAVPAWPHKIEASLTVLLSAPVQLFLTWRCWLVLKRRWFVALPLVVLIIGTVATTIYVVTILFLIQFATGETKTIELHGFFSAFTSCLTFDVVIDISVASILGVFLIQNLIRSHSNAHPRRCHNVFVELVSISWEVGIPQIACALAALIVCARGAPLVSYWAIMVQTIVGKIYVISLFVNLEARANLADLVNFPRLANTRRESDGTWAVAQNEYEKTDPVSLGYKADDTSVQGSTPDCPPPV